jgi:YVTN family beta-propeller protein
MLQKEAEVKHLRLFFLAMSVLPAVLLGQWLETTIPVGAEPIALCYNPQNNRVYCANRGDDNVTVIDGASNSVITAVTAGSGPYALCYNPQNNKAYSANIFSDNVTVVDGASNSVITTVTVGSGPRALCYNPQNNKVYCANAYSNDVTVIDGASNSVITTVTAGSGPYALCYNPQNNKVYCANYGYLGSIDNVTVIDGASDSVITTVTVGSWPQALCYNPQNNKVYCAVYYGRKVTVIDGASNSVIATVPAGYDPRALCYNPQNNRVYCANRGDDNVTVIDGASDSVITTVTVGSGPRALCYNPLNNKVYCANWSSGTVTVIDGASNQVLRTIGVGGGPYDFCHNPQQNRVYVSNEYGSSISVLRDTGGTALPDLELLPTSTASPPARMYFSNVSVSWPTGYTREYPYTDSQYVGAVVRNSGIVPVANAPVRFYVDGQPIGDTTIPAMNPGDTAVIDRVWALPNAVTESKLVEVRVDPDNTIPESNEANNNASEQVSVYYARRDRDSLPPQYDLRTDAYGQFTNFSWNSYDELWVAFGSYLQLWSGWSQPEKYMLGVLWPAYARLFMARGHCYGMAATSVHYFDWPGMVPPPFQRTYDLPLNAAQDNINEYHLTQFFDVLYSAFLGWTTNPSTEYALLRQSLRTGHQPVMIVEPQHATTGYKTVERERTRVVYVYDNEDAMGPPGEVTIPGRLATFGVSTPMFRKGGKDWLDYRLFGAHPDSFPDGFPHRFWDSETHDVLVRRPRLEMGDWARALLWELWQYLIGNQVAARQFSLNVACPVRSLVVDGRGRRIGFVGDSLVCEIPGASVDTGATTASYMLPDSLDYTLRTRAYDTGKMTVCLSAPVVDSTSRVVVFDTVVQGCSTTTALHFAHGDTSFSMEIDWDGNGTPDTTIYPNFNDTIGDPPVAVREPVKSTQLPTMLDLTVSSPRSAGTTAEIRYALPAQEDVSLIVYDAAGVLVKKLATGPRRPGFYRAGWNGTADNGRVVPGGVYFVTLEAGAQKTQRKVVLLR